MARLLEREAEIEAVLDAWRRARAGHGSAWFLCAEAGGGKTRLATDAARACGGRTLWGAAEPVTPPDPYLAVIRALPGFQPAATRAESVTRAVALLEDAAGASPIILVLDDLHFADEGTVAVATRLASLSAARPWLILAAYRPGEGVAGRYAPLVELAAQGTAHQLDLAPLSCEAVAALASETRGRPVVAEDAAALHAGSGGNPWFAEALARGAGAVEITRRRILVRLDQLELTVPGALPVLEALAPAVRPLPHTAVATLCGNDRRELRHILVGLRDAGVLAEQEGGWGFRHELLRQALLDAMLDDERRGAHRALAEALASMRAAAGAVGGPSSHQDVSAAELAMHFAAAGDPRAAGWALQATREARAIDAHPEAMAQLERALGFGLEPEARRETLQMASEEAYALGRFADSRRLAEEGLAIPGGVPEARARLHQLAARAAQVQGDARSDDAHLAAAERALRGRPVAAQTANIAVARVARAAMAIEPERLAAAAERALGVAGELHDPQRAAWVRVVTARYQAVSRIECGDPSGFVMLDDLLAEAVEHRLAPGTVVNALGGAYEEAVIALFHHQAAVLRPRLLEALERHNLGWGLLVEPYRILELVQRGSYAEASARSAVLAPPATGSVEEALLMCATILREARAGSSERARATLASATGAAGFQQRALLDLARLELAMLEGDAGLGTLAQQVYGVMNRRRYARAAGVAAVGLALSGRGAPPAPPWLVADSPLRVLWHWAEGIEHADPAALRRAAAQLESMECPYEAALARGDAGDAGEAYRALRALGATTARAQAAERLRATRQRIPRRTRAAEAPGGLTETERQVCRQVITGASNEEVAAALGVSIRTVETHLTHIYQKISRRGRAALIAWWNQQPEDTM